MPGEDDNKQDQFKEFGEKILGAVEALSERIGAVETNISDQSAGIKTLQDSATPPGGDDKSIPSLADMDLESLSRGDFANAISQSIVSAVQKQVLEPMNERVGSIQNTTEVQELRNEFGEVQGKHDDFALYKDAMLGMVETHSHLSVEEMYTIAKANNPEIAKTAASEEAEANPPPTQGDSFGGLTPTSGSTIQNKGEASADVAASDAWDETMTGSPLAEAQ